MVIIVLLNVAATCATPAVMFLRSFLRGRAAVAGFAIGFRGPVQLMVVDPISRWRRDAGRAAGRRGWMPISSPSSCRRSALPCLFVSAHWCACADRAPAVHGDA